MFFELINNIWFFTTFRTIWQQSFFPSELIGDVTISIDGQLFMSFEGIRYAEPAIGDLRFKDPVPIKEMVYLKKKVECLEWDPAYNQMIGEEDCLFLNVYTPVQFTNKAYPVLVWIHGTSFRFGSAQQGTYGPQRLIDQNLVVVTMSYRLGPLGFASLGHKDFSGNFGLKDQRLAINWVLENIERFGGDSDMVTLGGEGLGAAFVEHHLSGELSHKIRKAIAIGGSWMAPWALSTTERVKNETANLAKLLGCQTCTGNVSITEPIRLLHNIRSKEGAVIGTVKQSSYRSMMVSCEKATASCMRSIDPKSIVEKAFKMPHILPWDKIILPFLPIVDGDVVTNDPWIKRDSVEKYSLLIGLTRNEGSFLKSMSLISDWNLEDLKSAFDIFINGGVARGRNLSNNNQGLYDTVAALYSSGEIKDKLANLVTDGWFMFPALAEAKHHRGPFEAFMFDFDSVLKHMGCTVFRETDESSHGDQMPFMFFVYTCGTHSTSYELFARKFSNMIANFVYKGNPKLKSYSEDKKLYSIKNALQSPKRFDEINVYLSDRMLQWKSFNLF